MFQAAAAQHAGRPATVADPGAVGQAGTDTAQPAEVIQAGGGPPARQLDRGSGILPDKALKTKHKKIKHLFLDIYLHYWYLFATGSAKGPSTSVTCEDLSTLTYAGLASLAQLELSGSRAFLRKTLNPKIAPKALSLVSLSACVVILPSVGVGMQT